MRSTCRRLVSPRTMRTHRAGPRPPAVMVGSLPGPVARRGSGAVSTNGDEDAADQDLSQRGGAKLGVDLVDEAPLVEHDDAVDVGQGRFDRRAASGYRAGSVMIRESRLRSAVPGSTAAGASAESRKSARVRGGGGASRSSKAPSKAPRPETGGVKELVDSAHAVGLCTSASRLRRWRSSDHRSWCSERAPPSAPLLDQRAEPGEYQVVDAQRLLRGPARCAITKRPVSKAGKRERTRTSSSIKDRSMLPRRDRSSTQRRRRQQRRRRRVVSEYGADQHGVRAVVRRVASTAR